MGIPISLPGPTKRLSFRYLVPDDYSWFYQLNEDPEVIRFTGDPPFKNLEEARTFLEKYSEYEKNGFGRWAVILKESKEVIGWCGLKRNEENEVDVGFRFFRRFWNRGYATESVRASLTWGLEEKQLPWIVGRSMKENQASIRVMEKAGMSFWKEKDVPGMHHAVYYRITGPKYLG